MELEFEELTEQVSPMKSPLRKGDLRGLCFSGVILQPHLPPFLRGILRRMCHVTRLDKMKMPIQFNFFLCVFVP